MHYIRSVFTTTVWLLWRDMSILSKGLFNTILDSLIMPCSLIVIGGYILPYMGMPDTYGSFMVVGSIMMMCFGSACWLGAGPLVADLETDRSITYELTLPLPSWLVMVKIATGFALRGAVVNLMTLPLGKLLLGNRFDLTHFSVLKFALSYITANLLFGFFGVIVALWVKDSYGFGRFWLRIGSQLNFFSGLQFSWLTLRLAWPALAYIDLCNPLVYAFESNRAAVLGQTGSLDYWLCLAVMWLWIMTFVGVGSWLIKRRLDCV